MDRETLDDEQRTESEEADIPRERLAEVVAHVVDAEQVVVDITLHEVEKA